MGRIRAYFKAGLPEEAVDDVLSFIVRGLVVFAPLLVLFLFGAGWIGYGLALQGQEESVPQQPPPVEVTVQGNANQTLRVAPEEPLPARGNNPRGAPSPAIPGLGVMDVIGQLNAVPSGQSFRCPGPSSDRGSLVWRCTSDPGEGGAAPYTVSVVGDDALHIRSVTATANSVPDDEAAEFLGYVAGLALGGAGTADPRSWVEENLASGGRLVAGDAEASLYGTEKSRTVTIVATGVPAEERRTEGLTPKAAQDTTGITPGKASDKADSTGKAKTNPK